MVARHNGQPDNVKEAGVAAVSQQIADDAPKLVKVWYDETPFVVDRSDARVDDAPMVFPGPADEAGSGGGGGGPKGVPQKGNVFRDHSRRRLAIPKRASPKRT
jgi:xanthine dehydrogenase YagR molybdenum-binding subunit